MAIVRPFRQQRGHSLARLGPARAGWEFKHLRMIERILEPDRLAYDYRRRGLLGHGLGHDRCWSRRRGGDMFALRRALRYGSQRDQSAQHNCNANDGGDAPGGPVTPWGFCAAHSWWQRWHWCDLLGQWRLERLGGLRQHAHLLGAEHQLDRVVLDLFSRTTPEWIPHARRVIERIFEVVRASHYSLRIPLG
jgi:hypothetical protein